MDPIQQPITPVQPTPQITPPPAPIQPAPTMMPAMPPEHKSWGAIISIVIILALLIAAAIYVWGQKQNNDAKKMPASPEAPAAVQTQKQAAPAEPVDELVNMEQELDASVDGLDDSNF